MLQQRSGRRLKRLLRHKGCLIHEGKNSQRAGADNGDDAPDHIGPRSISAVLGSIFVTGRHGSFASHQAGVSVIFLQSAGIDAQAQLLAARGCSEREANLVVREGLAQGLWRHRRIAGRKCVVSATLGSRAGRLIGPCPRGRPRARRSQDGGSAAHGPGPVTAFNLALTREIRRGRADKGRAF